MKKHGGLDMRVNPGCWILFVCSLMVGCSSMTNGIALSGSEGGAAKLQKESSSLGQQVGLELQQLRRMDDRLELAVKVKSHIAYDQSLQYKIDWFDEGGMPVEPDSAYWQPLILHGGEQKIIRSSAPLSDATSFSFAVRNIVKD